MPIRLRCGWAFLLKTHPAEFLGSCVIFLSPQHKLHSEGNLKIRVYFDLYDRGIRRLAFKEMHEQIRVHENWITHKMCLEADAKFKGYM